MIVDIFNNKMILDKQDILQISTYNIHEPMLTKYIHKNIKKGDIVLDVGAHIGYFTLIFSNLVGDAGHIYAFEPCYQSFLLNKKNIKLNDKKNVTIENLGISDRKSKTYLYTSDKNNADHRLFFSKDEPDRKTDEIETVSLDIYAKENKIIDKINVIKIDVQGHDFSVIKGMKEILKRNKEIIVLTEYWPYGLGLADVTSKEFLDIFLNEGFKYTTLDDKYPNSHYSIDTLLSIPQDTDGWFINLAWRRDI